MSTRLTKPLRRAGAIVATTAMAGTAIAIGTTQLAIAGSATATTGVNIRSGPGTSYDIVGGLVRGQRITAVGKPHNGWIKVRFNGDSAYVSADYLRVGGKSKGSSTAVTIHTKGIKITTAPLNVRAGAGLDRKVVGYLSSGQQVTLTGKQSRGFAEILYGGQRAWVSAQYLVSSTSGLPSSTRTRTATADLLIRTSTDADFKIITTVRKGTKLKVTGATKNGYAQVIYNNAIRWVTARYLTSKDVAGPVAPKPDKPKPKPKPRPDKPKDKPKPDRPAPLPSVVGTRYATTELLVRTTSGSDYRTVATVQRGDKVKITGSYRNGRAQIIYGGAVRWVTSQYLSKTKPGTTRPSDDGGSGGGTDPSYNGKSRDVPNRIWDELSMCEASGNWSINTGNGFYGGLQFTLQTWRGFGGTGMPHHASRLEQIKIAERVLAVQGWGAWPACSRKLGLR